MLLRRLEYVEQTAKHGTIQKASQQLFVSESGISQQIQKLEETFKVKLFTKKGRKIQLTDEGKRLLPAIQHVLNSVKELERQVSELREPLKGTIEFGLGPIVTDAILTDIVTDFYMLYPKITINNIEKGSKELLELLYNDLLDVIIIALPNEVKSNFVLKDNIIYENILQTKLSIVVSHSHPLANCTNVSLENFPDSPLIFYSKSFSSEIILELLGSKNNIVYTENLNALRKLVKQNFGITILPEFYVNSWKNEQKEGLKFLTFDKEPLILNWGCVYKKKPYQPKYLTDFINILLKYAKKNLEND